MPEVKDAENTVFYPETGETVWGEDAPLQWERMASLPPVRTDREVTFTNSAAVDEILHRPEVFSSGPEAGYLGSEVALIPLQIDPPEHVRYRRMLDPLFAPKRMNALEHDIAALAVRCMDEFIERGSCDFSDEFSIPYPAGTFLRLLGLPMDGLAEFVQLKEDIIRPAGGDSPEGVATRERAGKQIASLFIAALTDRRKHRREDILSHFAQLEASGDLTRDESIGICHLLLIAGLDTVTGTLECAFALLARRPDLRRSLAGRLDVIPSAVVELLRWIVTSPVQTRIAVQDVEVQGFEVKKGEIVRAAQATMNFDPARIPDPLNVDFGREENRHATFGIGIHRCLGSHLARLELRIAMSEWHARIPEYELGDDFVVKYTPALRGVSHLALQFPPGRRAT